MVESERDSMRNWGSQGILVPSPKEREHAHCAPPHPSTHTETDRSVLSWHVQPAQGAPHRPECPHSPSLAGAKGVPYRPPPHACCPPSPGCTIPHEPQVPGMPPHSPCPASPGCARSRGASLRCTAPCSSGTPLTWPSTPPPHTSSTCHVVNNSTMSTVDSAYNVQIIQWSCGAQESDAVIWKFSEFSTECKGPQCRGRGEESSMPTAYHWSVRATTHSSPERDTTFFSGSLYSTASPDRSASAPRHTMSLCHSNTALPSPD